ncbi:MAG: glucose-6-phosphate dehydrogenase [Phycisphaerales bacterium]|nr:glucose-6-phosphate dehydrogenase [Phycisphaerales bacterium]
MTSRVSEPGVLVIFGGTGDLARRKLIPALASLAAGGLLHEAVQVLGISRSREHDDDSYRDLVRRACVDAGRADAIDPARFHFFSMPGGTPEEYQGLADRLGTLRSENELPPRHAFYLALPIAAMGKTIEALGAAGLAHAPDGGWTRIVVEKPFGHDLDSARALVDTTRRHFEETQVYRIDHYLGKETVQNLLAFRFGNAIFESLWNRDRIAAVEIMVAESVGVGDRGDYYDASGALRDMVQNHLAQLLTLVAMEVPPVIGAESVRYEKTKVLRSIAPITSRDVVFGQYAAGTIDGEAVPGYRDETGIDAGSTTETFAALKLEIMNWRWQGVPFYVRTGKRLPRRLTRIGVRFRSSPVCMFEHEGVCHVSSDVLILTLQPDEGFSLHIDVKKPGSLQELQRIPLTFRYRDQFDGLPDAYETLLHDVLEGDQTLFVHSEEVLESWRLLDPILADPPVAHPYKGGTWGPEAAAGWTLGEPALMREGR